jgi:hypothetical protein
VSFQDYQNASPERLRKWYWEWRELEYMASQTLHPKSMRTSTERVEMIERIADNRGISLSKEEVK